MVNLLYGRFSLKYRYLLFLIEACAVSLIIAAIADHVAVRWSLFIVGVGGILAGQLVRSLVDPTSKVPLEEPIPVAMQHSFGLGMPVNEDTEISHLAKHGFRGDLVLFFDIDGVLHPNQTETLEYKDRLLTLTDRLPALELVMCSDWRLSSTQEWFENLFGDELSRRFMGCTPLLSGPGFVRQREIEKFCSHFRVKQFAVVDDRPDLYMPDYQALVITSASEGLIDNVAQQLFEKLS
tara:strand:- start:21481 stop:22191 length:711 start_codon:yes stop_codon:yes gene_type:complete